MEEFASSMARKLRLELEAYIARRPEFLSSLAPITADPGAPRVARAMIAASGRAGVGPMAAVAGAVAEELGRGLAAEFGCREVIVENGGDLWLRFEDPIDISVFAGASPLSEKVGVSIPSEFSPLGVCTSSGTVGPSLSLGRADAAMVAARSVGGRGEGGRDEGGRDEGGNDGGVISAALADAWATAVGNAVSSTDDIEAALALAEGREGVVSVLVVKDARMGIRGSLPLKLFRA
jgi:hypothetical protein